MINNFSGDFLYPLHLKKSGGIIFINMAKNQNKF